MSLGSYGPERGDCCSTSPDMYRIVRPETESPRGNVTGCHVVSRDGKENT